MRMLDVCAHTAQFTDPPSTPSWMVFVQASFTWEHVLYLRTDAKNNRMWMPIKWHACHNRLPRRGSFNFSLTICSVMCGERRLRASFVLEIAQCILYVWISLSLSLALYSSIHKATPYLCIPPRDLSRDYRSVFLLSEASYTTHSPRSLSWIAVNCSCKSVPFIKHSLLSPLCSSLLPSDPFLITDS